MEAAIASVLDDGLRTKDIMSAGMKEVGTTEMGDAILAEFRTQLAWTISVDKMMDPGPGCRGFSFAVLEKPFAVNTSCPGSKLEIPWNNLLLRRSGSSSSPLCWSRCSCPSMRIFRFRPSPCRTRLSSSTGPLPISAPSDGWSMRPPVWPLSPT